jgi:ABC-type multidrug transport system permease subunit
MQSLVIGFSFFMADNTQQGLQNQMYGVLVFLFVVITLIFRSSRCLLLNESFTNQGKTRL